VRIDQLLAQNGRPVFSFEFFPPKTHEGEQNLEQTGRVVRIPGADGGPERWAAA